MKRLLIFYSHRIWEIQKLKNGIGGRPPSGWASLVLKRFSQNRMRSSDAHFLYIMDGDGQIPFPNGSGNVLDDRYCISAFSRRYLGENVWEIRQKDGMSVVLFNELSEKSLEIRDTQGNVTSLWKDFLDVSAVSEMRNARQAFLMEAGNGFSVGHFSAGLAEVSWMLSQEETLSATIDKDFMIVIPFRPSGL